MAERRMFAKTIVLSDAFLDMPLGARCLYLTMSMLADDDGFVNSPKSIIRQTGATEDDLKVLIAKKFIIPFDNGIIVIKHWRINNYLRNDRYQPTVYIEQLEQLSLDENKAYTTKPNSVGIPSMGIPSIGKDSIGKDSIGESIEEKRTRFSPPTLEELKAYNREKRLHIDCEKFIDYYTSNGWMVGRNHMKDWRAAARNWSKNGKPYYSAEDEMNVPEETEEDIEVLREKMFGAEWRKKMYGEEAEG